MGAAVGGQTYAESLMGAFAKRSLYLATENTHAHAHRPKA